METHGGFPLPQDFLTFPALEIGVEDETVIVESLQENHADIGKTILIDRCQSHGIRIVRFGGLR